jgi:acetyltransferase-like isoleucine patch superfamily enzyme
VNAIPRASFRALGKAWRATWTVATLVLVECTVFGLALTPAVLLSRWWWGLGIRPAWLAVPLHATVLVPAYGVFAFTLMALSAVSSRLLGWRTPPDGEMRIADLEWPLLRWVCYLASTHLVRVCAGEVFRATPVWTTYHRWNGARMGRRVYVNSLTVMDDNLLEFGDGVVIGHGVHLSGHTVERGFVKTAEVRLGADVTIGVGAVIGIGVDIGAGTQVGALSVVPKHQRLEPGAVFVGAPARRLDAPHADPGNNHAAVATAS